MCFLPLVLVPAQNNKPFYQLCPKTPRTPPSSHYTYNLRPCNTVQVQATYASPYATANDCFNQPSEKKRKRYEMVSTIPPRSAWKIVFRSESYTRIFPTTNTQRSANNTSKMNTKCCAMRKMQLRKENEGIRKTYSTGRAGGGL